MFKQSFTTQDEVAAYARERLTSQLNRARALVGAVDDQTMTQPRADGGWSPAAVLDHLAVMNRLYLPHLERAIVSAEPSSRRDWKPTLGGRMLRWSVTTSVKLRTPSLFKPNDPRSDVGSLDRFLRSQEELLGVLERSAPLHWKSVQLSSPASKFVKLNLGDVLVVLADHVDRHLNQIEACLTA